MPITFWPEDWGRILWPHAPILELVVRGVVVYAFLFTLLRVVARRELSSFAISDLLVLLLLATAVRLGLTGSNPGLGDAFISALTLIGMDRLVNVVTYRWPVARDVLRGKPIQIIRDGRLLKRAAREELLTRGEIQEKLRESGVEDMTEVAAAYVEPDGRFSVIRKGDGGGGGQDTRNRQRVM